MVTVVPWAAPFRRCPRGVLSSRCPSAFLGRVRILPLGVVAGKFGDLRTSGRVLAARDRGFLPPWVSGVPLVLGNGTYPGRVLSGGRAAGDGRTRASTFDEAARTLGHPGPKACPLAVNVYLVSSCWWQSSEEAVRVEVVVPILHVVRGIRWRKGSVVSYRVFLEVHFLWGPGVIWSKAAGVSAVTVWS